MTAPISAVLVTYNSAHCVAPCLESLQEHVRPVEFVVVDNASRDGSVDTVRATAPEAVVIEPGTNIGFGRACNLAVERAGSPYVLLVNPDTVFVRADRSALDRTLAHDPLGLVVPLLSDASAGAPRHAVFPYGSWRRDVARQAWAHLRPRELTRRPTAPSALENAWPAATVLLVRRDEFLALGGFDRRYFLYAEDVDLARRYREQGLPLVLTESVVAAHAGAASSAADDDTKPIPHAWSILGTLEYVAIWNGERHAARAARFVLLSLRVQRVLLAAARHVPGLRARMARKGGQVRAIDAFLREHGRGEHGDFNPGAALALSSAGL